jgi:hypothetical protein
MAAIRNILKQSRAKTTHIGASDPALRLPQPQPRHGAFAP